MKKLGIIIPAGGMGVRMAASEATGASTSAVAGAASGTASEVTGAAAEAAEKARKTARDTPKQFLLLGGRPVLARTIEAFRSVAPEAEIVVALPADRLDEWAGLCLEYDVPAHKICEGGATRFLSVQNALAETDHTCEYIAVHDAARPLVSPELILRTIETARRHGSAIPVVPLIDSVRRLTENGSHLEDRSTLRGVQTPQVFRADILRTGYERAVGDDFGDDATVVESVGYTVMLTGGERRNIKLTEPEDMTIAEALL
jgi:2-C-methyl-D-erythritol 4-phosphate cytidylyltransferase